MPRPKKWADLLPGLATLGVLTALVVGVLVFANIGGLRGRTTRVHAAVPSARGILAGSEVWLGGRRIGTVDDVVFRAPTADTAARVLLVLDVLERDRHAIRRDADVRIRSGGSFVGAPVVAFTSGSPSAPPIEPGDTIVSRGPTYVDRARADLAATAAQVPAVLANLRLLSAQLQSARGTLGALGLATTAATVQATTAVGATVVDRALHGPGTIPLTLSGGALAAAARHAAAQSDSIRQLLASSSTSLGRFHRDSTLLRAVETVRADVALLAARAEAPVGTVGRLRADAAAHDALVRTRAELDAVVADLKRNPLRYLAF